MRKFTLSLALVCLAAARAQDVAPTTFTNPLLPSAPDPWVIFHDGFYYFTATTATDLTLWKTRDITDLRHAERKVVWTPPSTGPYSHDVWAPELHFVNGKWYLYFAADDGKDIDHRIWVLENTASDPLEGSWQMKGELRDRDDDWAIDPSIFQDAGQLYAIWSGWDQDHVQCIFISKMKNPWTLQGKSVELSYPQFAWERASDGHPGTPEKSGVNEGPEILQHAGKIFLVYSASPCWTDQYTLGILMADAGVNLLKRSSWRKADGPVFSTSAAAHAFGPGHNTFFKSPDGTEDWILYHANPEPHQGCREFRSPRAQPFTWNADGTPRFGSPVQLDQQFPKPSGTAPP